MRFSTTGILTVTFGIGLATLAACGDASIEGDRYAGYNFPRSAPPKSAGSASATPTTPAPPPGGTTPTPPPPTPTNNGADAGSTPPPSTPPSTPPPAATCGTETTATACYACCDKLHPAGAAAFQKGWQAYGVCACATPGTCKTQCATTFCAGTFPAAGSTCDACLTGATACDAAYDVIVNAEPDYAQLLACDQASNCEAKP